MENQIEVLKKALTPFISEAKPSMPGGADPTLWVQLYINMNWLRDGYLALHPEKKEQLEKTEDFYSFLSQSISPDTSK